jgi:hypothetical protein
MSETTPTKSKWTEGPWTGAEPWSGFSSIHGANGELVFGIAAGHDEERQPPDACAANFRLILASPSLYAALEALVAEANRLGPQLPYNAPTKDITLAIDRARDALNAANPARGNP